MPTYTVTSVEGCLDAPKRAKIASEITRIHSETTSIAIGGNVTGSTRPSALAMAYNLPPIANRHCQ
jgi:hypothetical protein